MTRRLSLILGLVMALSIVAAPLAAAHDGRAGSRDGDRFSGATLTAKDLPTRIDLPDGFQPEGITSGFNSRLYVGSLANGAIWRGSARTGEGRLLVEGVEGRQAVGLRLDWRAVSGLPVAATTRCASTTR